MNIRERLYGDHDPYCRTAPIVDPFEPQTWGGRDPIFGDLIDDVEPTRIVEIGTWQGGSAITMSKHAPETEIICVDTFLGSPWHWATKERREHLLLANGFPTLFWRFQLAVLAHGRTDYITPMPMTSRQAASMFRDWGESADLIYIDANHEQWGVASDIVAWWGLVNPGGVMFGHDFNDIHPGVCEAVRSFFGRDGFEVRGDFWVARKGSL